MAGLLAACAAATAQTAPTSQAPLRIGAISSITGPAPFPESAEAVRAYFDLVNAQGGVRGRKLQLVVEDDQGDPAIATRAARKLLDDVGVVAHVGSASIVDCKANAGFYESRGLVSIQGTGVEPECFGSAQIAPVNTGPYLSLRNALQFASEVLGAKRPCAMVLDLPGMRPAYQSVIESWARSSGRPLPMTIYFRGDEDLGLLQQQTQQQSDTARCDAIVHTGIEPMVLAWAKARRKHAALRAIPQVFLTPAYTARVANELGADDDKIYCLAEFEPWSSRSGALTDWRLLMTSRRIPLSSFSQGGYTAAQLMVRVLRSIDGEITRASVAKALRALGSVELPMLGTPFRFGDSPRHNPNRATLPMLLRDGAWRIAHPFWIVAPE